MSPQSPDGIGPCLRILYNTEDTEVGRNKIDIITHTGIVQRGKGVPPQPILEAFGPKPDRLGLGHIPAFTRVIDNIRFAFFSEDASEGTVIGKPKENKLALKLATYS